MTRLTSETGQELVRLGPTRTYPAGTRLLRQGEASDHIYLLRPGPPHRPACVKVTATLENGIESLLGIRVSGEIVGELAGLLDGVRTATATTCASTTAHVIARDVFTAFLARRPDAWAAVAGVIADQLQWANQRRLEFAGYAVPVRLARVMVELVDRHGFRTDQGHELGIELSQTELGRLIGAGEDAVGQAMRQLRRSGLVTSHYRKVTINDLHDLRLFGELS